MLEIEGIDDIPDICAFMPVTVFHVEYAFFTRGGNFAKILLRDTLINKVSTYQILHKIIQTIA